METQAPGQADWLARTKLHAALKSALQLGEFARCVPLIARALTHPLIPETRAEALVTRAWVELLMGNDAQAAADLEAVLAMAEKSRTLGTLSVLAFHLNPPFAILPGGLECLERFCQLTAAHMGEQASPVQAATGGVLTFLHFWRGRLHEAVETGERTLALSQRFGGGYALEGEVAATLKNVYIARRDYAAAERFLERTSEHAGQVAMLGELLRVNTLASLGRMRWLEACTDPPSTSSGRRFDAAQGRPGRSSWLEEIRQIHAQMRVAVNAQETPWAPALLATMQGRLGIAEKRYADAERALRQAIVMERQTPSATLYGNPRVLLAHLYLVWGRPNVALAELLPALAECEQQGTLGRILLEGAAALPVLRLAVERGVYATYATYLLGLMGAGVEPWPARVPDTGETLTRREVEVLRLMATGAGNREIAAQLVISEHTVKTHVHHILRKLDVATRTEAAARARELRLV